MKGRQMKIVFVCTGNTCRSPMAKAIAEAASLRAGIEIEFKSAGTCVTSASPASEHARAASAANGLDLSGHLSRQVDAAELHSADLILTMTLRHKDYLSSKYPGHEAKTFTISEYTDGCEEDVDDPFGGGRREYDACYAQLSALIDRLIKKLNVTDRQKGSVR